MQPVTKEIETSRGLVKVYDLTIGYMSDIQRGIVDDTELNAVLNGTDLTEETIRDYRASDIAILSDAIMRLTYPEAYDEDGNGDIKT